MGAFSIEQDSRIATAQNTRMAQLLRRVPKVRNAQVVQGAEPTAREMGTQQIQTVQAKTLVLRAQTS